MTKRTVVAFFIVILIYISFVSFGTHIANADFDCLTLSISSSQTDKDYCKDELSQIEAQLIELLNKQKEQQKQTGTLKGDVNFLTSQINALKTKINWTTYGNKKKEIRPTNAFQFF